MLDGKMGEFKVPALQADVTLSQANPVSGTKYEVLPTTANVRVLSAAVSVTWTVQPSPSEAHFTISGQVITHSKANPNSAANYYPYLNGANAITVMPMDALASAPYDFNAYRAFLYEARSCKVEAETTGGTVQNLTSRVKYAKW